MANNAATTLQAERTSRGFYIIGGTLRRDAPCYVERLADAQLYQALKQGQFCYVLTSRQMGKSSLMVRAASRLREEGIGVAVLDLTAIGQNVNAEQWYGGLLSQTAQQLDLEDEMIEFWRQSMSLGPLQRWLQAIRRVVLPRCVGPVAFFVDEIDAVLGLPFSTDEFFAGVRELYNFRTEDAELERLTFCLLGVASPSDLIHDTRITPFNIGQRIELRDFTEAEAAQLAEGLRRDEPLAGELLQRVFYWTGGHPYLTQRLCKAVAEDARVMNVQGVDLLCEEMFFARRASEQDDNLLFVRERMLRSEVDLAGLLTLYARVRQGKRVEDEEANQLAAVLRLSGVARADRGLLKPRNHIYSHVFDRAWIAKHMPDAEMRRQRAAYRRGVIRASVIAALLLSLIGSLLFIAVKKNNLANEQMEENRRVLYAAQMNLAQQNWEYFSVERVLNMLDEQVPKPGQEDLRNFEWYYLWRLCHSERFTLRGDHGAYQAVFSPDGRLVATTAENAAKLWETATGKEARTFQGHTGKVTSVAFSPEGRRLATASFDGAAKLWDVENGQELATFEGHGAALLSVAFAPDGQRVASLDTAGRVKVWSASSAHELITMKLNGDRSDAGVNGIAFSPDGKWLAAGVNGCKVWDAATGKQYLDLLPGKTVGKPRFSPDGKWLVAPSNPTSVFEVATGKEVMTLSAHFDWVFGASFTADGKYLATASRDQCVKLWDTRSWQQTATLKGHSDSVMSAEFSPSGASLVTASFDKTVKLWDVAPLLKREKLTKASTYTLQALLPERVYLSPVAFSPSGERFASAVTEHTGDGAEKPGAEVGVWDLATGAQLLKLAGDGAVTRSVAFTADGRGLVTGDSTNAAKLWDAATGQLLRAFTGHAGEVTALACSADGKLLATGSTDRTVKLWDVATAREVGVGAGHGASVIFAAFAPNGQRLATVSADWEVRVWETATGHTLAVIKLPPPVEYGFITGAFSPDGRQLVTAYDAVIRQLDVATGREVRRLTGHAKDVSALTFSPDGKRLASVGEDRTARLWDWMTGRELAALRTEINPVAIGFTRDGSALTTVTSRYVVNQWRAASAADAQTHSQQPRYPN